MWSKDDSWAVAVGCSTGIVFGQLSVAAGIGLMGGNVITAVTAIAGCLSWYVIKG